MSPGCSPGWLAFSYPVQSFSATIPTEQSLDPMKTYPESFRYCKATVMGRPDSRDGHGRSQVVASTGEPSSSPALLHPRPSACAFFLQTFSHLFFLCLHGLNLLLILVPLGIQPRQQEIQSIVVRIRIKGQDSNSALAGLYGHSSVHCSRFKSCPTL